MEQSASGEGPRVSEPLLLFPPLPLPFPLVKNPKPPKLVGELPSSGIGGGATTADDCDAQEERGGGRAPAGGGVCRGVEEEEEWWR